MWIESHTTVGAHPKTRKLGRRLGINVPQAVGHLHLLWHWAVDYAQDGDLTRHDAEDIALGAQWDGEPDIFLEALSDAGWIDADDSGRRIHDWHDFAGKLIEAREAGSRGNHKRWHVDKGVTVPSCRFCKAESAAPVGGESGASIPPESGAISGGESTSPTSPTVPTNLTSPGEAEGANADDEDPQAAIVKTLSDYCTGKNRAGVQAEAHRLVAHCIRYLDIHVLEEAIGWAIEKFDDDPKLPRAFVPTIETFAKKRGVDLNGLKARVVR
jgi:hypothetical protein